MEDDSVAQFMSITDQNATVAAGYLSMTEGDVMGAVNMFFENPDIASSFTQQQAAPGAASSSATAPPVPASSRPQQRPIGRQDASGVIHIDDDDDDDDDDPAFDIPDDEFGDEGTALQRIAQESDDAAMAQRLQQEMYGENNANRVADDGVRAPIARTTETLVAPTGYGGGMADNDYGHMLAQMRRRNRPEAASNPFGQSIWEDNAAGNAPTYSGAAGGSRDGPQSRAQRLADLFRPPYELMDHMAWDDARGMGKEQKKWILVNVQDMNDFNCQALNRDIWKDDAIAALVKENFIFLQYSKEDPRAVEYNTFYFPQHAQENRENFPHVSIIDPRTGEQVKVWTGTPFPTAQDFHAQLAEFLDRYSLAQNSKNPVVKQKRPERAVDVDRMTEEEMLEMALRNSLETNGNGSSGAVNVHDPDELTKSLELDKGKGKAVAAGADQEDQAMEDIAEDAAGEASSSAFSSIPSDKPHTEPANDPATTTRIQFRHANGRVIRRFALSDSVVRIYEWLKAEPLDGKTGVEFELKVMPQGKDLLEDVDKTIQDAGLKQATVMIEYIEA